MIQLSTLGRFELTIGPDAGDGGIASQPKRAAVLAYLAAARPVGYQRRDVLLAMIWPETDTEHARQGLRQVLLQLRKVLGADAIQGRGTEELRLHPDLVEVDCRQFEQLIAEGQVNEGFRQYRGDFLSGFHLPGATEEWEEWIEGERQRLRALATNAAWQMARKEEQAGNSSGAGYWGWRAIELAPTDDSGMRQLLSLLLRLGDRPGAARAAAGFLQRARDPRSAAPTPELLRLCRLAQEGADADPPPNVAPSPAASVTAGPIDPTPANVPATPRWPTSLRWGVPLLLLILATAWLALKPVNPRPDEALAIGWLEDLSPPDSAIPTPVLRDLLTTSIARLPGVGVVSAARTLELEAQLGDGLPRSARGLEAARLAGAGVLLAGRVRHDGAGYTLDLTATGIRSGTIRYTVEARATDLFALADEATAALSRQLHLTVPLVPVREVSTPSLLAYRFYEEGLRAYTEVDWVSAARFFRSASEEDSSFAMPWYYGSLVADVLGNSAKGDSLLGRALSLAGHTPDRERLLIRARWTARASDPAMLAVAETLAVRYPAEPVGLLALGEARLTFGDPASALDPLWRVIRMDSLGLRGRTILCRACEAYALVVQASTQLNRFDDAAAALEGWRHARADPRALVYAGVMAEQLDRPSGDPEVARILDSSRVVDEGLDFQIRLRRGDFAALDLRLHNLLGREEASQRADAAWWLHISLRTQGRLAEALASASNAATRGELQGAQILCESGRGATGAQRFREIADRALTGSQPYHQAKHRSWYLTHAATCLALAGDTAALGPLADTIQYVGAQSSWLRNQRLYHYVRGLRLEARGEIEAAVGEFRQAMTLPTEGFTRINYELGGSLLRSGRSREAVEPLQAALRGPLDAGGLYLTRTEIEERLAQVFAAVGQRDSAVAHYRYVVTAWRTADPVFLSRWEAARRFTESH